MIQPHHKSPSSSFVSGSSAVSLPCLGEPAAFLHKQIPKTKMARPVVVLALVLIAFVGLASAETQGNEIPKSDTGALAAAAAVPTEGPTSDDAIGNSDDGASQQDVVEAPVGGPVPPGAFPPSSETPYSGASSLGAVSAIAGAALAAAAATAAAGYLF